eukprot:9319186-Pyramimonas_sp.AAC.1
MSSFENASSSTTCPDARRSTAGPLQRGTPWRGGPGGLASRSGARRRSLAISAAAGAESTR